MKTGSGTEKSFLSPDKNNDILLRCFYNIGQMVHRTLGQKATCNEKKDTCEV